MWLEGKRRRGVGGGRGGGGGGGGGGGFVVLRIIKQSCDQLRVLVYSPDVGPIVGPKVWSLSYIFLIVQSPGVES